MKTPATIDRAARPTAPQPLAATAVGADLASALRRALERGFGAPVVRRLEQALGTLSPEVLVTAGILDPAAVEVLLIGGDDVRAQDLLGPDGLEIVQDCLGDATLTLLPSGLPQPGDELAGCTILAELGRGGSSVVYRAYHRRRQVEVALKLVIPDGSLPAEVAAREGRVLSRLQHPVFVRALEWSGEGRLPYLLCELVDGVALDEVLDDLGTLPADQALPMFCELAEALEHAAQRGVVHGDLKPQNVLVDRRGRPRLIDLGLATSTGERLLSSPEYVLGTLPYLSSERLRGQPADVLADIYALGVTFYEALTGYLPFSAVTPRSLLEQHRMGATPAHQLSLDVSPALAGLLGRMLDWDSRRRPQSFAEVARLLSEIGAHQRRARRAIRRQVA